MKKKLYIVLFIIFITIPPLTGIFMKNSSTENRALSEFPQIKDGLSLYLKGLNTYIVDRTPFKDTAVQLVRMLENSYDETYETKLGILGNENWMFYKGDDGSSSINDYLGLRSPSTEELKETKAQIKKLEKVLKKKKAKLVVLISPNKEDVYEEYLPDKYQKSSKDKTYAQQVVDYLQKDGKNVIYPLDELKATDSFYKYDSHWNDLGAYAAVLAVEAYLGYPSVSFDNITIQRTEKDGGDMFSILKLDEKEYEKDVLYHIQTGKKVEATLLDTINYGNSISYREIETTAKNKQHLFLIGDSYSTAMLPYLQEDFKQVSVVHRGDIEKVNLHGVGEGDVVMVEVAGRYADTIGNTCQRILEAFK